MAGTDLRASKPNAGSLGRARSLRCESLLAHAMRIAVGVAFLVAPAHAEVTQPSEAPQLEVSIDYVAPPGCPDMRTFEHTVASRLGYYPFRNAATHHVLVRIETSTPNLFGHVEWHDPRGEWVGDQSFPARKADCVELARTMAIALAVQIHLLANAEVPASQPTTTTTTPASASASPSASGERSPAASKPAAPRADFEPKPTDAGTSAPPEKQHASRWNVGLGAGLSVGHGLSSSVVGLGRLFALVSRRPFALELGAELALPSTTRRADGAGYTQQLLFGSLAGCNVHPLWSACVVAKVGMARVQGRDIDVPASDSNAILQTGLRATVSPMLGASAFLAARVEGLATLTPWTVTLDGLGVWTAPPFTASVGLDAGVFLP